MEEQKMVSEQMANDPATNYKKEPFYLAWTIRCSVFSLGSHSADFGRNKRR